MQTQSLAQIVIVGGGFGGLSAAKELAAKGVCVTLIDKTNHHLFRPLLYQVATACLSPADIAQPIRHILKDAKNIEVVMGEAASVDPHSRQVRTTDTRSYPYDYLILAGRSTSFLFWSRRLGKIRAGLKKSGGCR